MAKIFWYKEDFEPSGGEMIYVDGSRSLTKMHKFPNFNRVL